MSDPQRQEIIIENIPAELKQGRHWLCWRLECVKERWTKVPYRPFGPLRKARSNDPGTWGTFEQALRYCRSHPEITGIGIAFADDLVGIDLDHCISAGEIQPWAHAIIERAAHLLRAQPIRDRCALPGQGQPAGETAHRHPAEPGRGLPDRDVRCPLPALLHRDGRCHRGASHHRASAGGAG